MLGDVLKHCRLQRNMPKACPYVMMRPIMADINHYICEGITHLGIFLLALSDNLIYEDWFFAESCFLCFLFQSPSIYPLNDFLKIQTVL